MLSNPRTVMEPRSSKAITGLLAGWSGGDQAAFDQLVPVVYEELHGIAGRRLQHERVNHTLQPTALVQEVLGISPTTISREWSRAKAWLYREVRKGDRP